MECGAEKVPPVLVVGGLDPSGAGLQADIETCLALGCHALPVATAITVQTTRGLERVIALGASDIREQICRLLMDVGEVAACKIGMVPEIDIAAMLVEVLDELPAETAIILDPVMAASAGGALMSPALVDTYATRLLPRATLVKPNVGEALRLSGASDRATAGRILSQADRCRYALLTGTDTAEDAYSRHYLYREGVLFAEYAWPLLEGRYHGTGCTLSSAIAANCALGDPPERAVAKGLAYTWRTVRAAKSIGGAQCIPHRLADRAGRVTR